MLKPKLINNGYELTILRIVNTYVRSKCSKDTWSGQVITNVNVPVSFTDAHH